MRILFIVPYSPNPIRVRPFEFLRTLAGHHHELTLASVFTGEGELRDLHDLADFTIETKAFELTTARRAWNVLGALPSTIPLQAAYSWQPALAQSIVNLIRTGSFDVIHVEHIRGARYAQMAKDVLTRGRIPTPIVWDSVDCISELFRLASVRSRSFFGRWVTRFELPRTTRYEAELIRSFDTTLVTSPNDREALLALGQGDGEPGPIEVVPNGVNLEYFAPNPSVARRQDQIVMTGKMSYHANVTMVVDFIERIFPLIRRARPDVNLTVVGKDPSPEIRELAKDPAISVTGTVQDMRPYLWQSTLAVAPMTYSVGIQNKVLEALATATPIVTSTGVSRSINLAHGESALIADDPKLFAEHVLRLLDDPTLRDAMGRRGRELAEQEYGWEGVTRKMEDIYRGLIHAHR